MDPSPGDYLPPSSSLRKLAVPGWTHRWTHTFERKTYSNFQTFSELDGADGSLSVVQT